MSAITGPSPTATDDCDNATHRGEEVLQAAAAVFRQHGYAGTSIQMLVDATGASRTAIYNDFGDKSALFLAALARYCNEMSDLTALGQPLDLVWRATVDYERGAGAPCLLTRSCSELDQLPEGSAEIVTEALKRQWTQLNGCAKRNGMRGAEALREATLALVLRHGFAALGSGGLPGEELRAAATMLLK